MTRIIINSSPMHGHFTPIPAIAADLVERGHHVTVLTGTVFRGAVEKTGAVFAALTGAADHDPVAVSSSPERLAVPNGPLRFEYDMRTTFVASMAEQHAALQGVLAQAAGEPVVVLSETGFLGVTPLMLGAPGLRPKAFVGLGVPPFTLSSIDVAPFGMALPPDSSEAGRARNREANRMLQEQVLGAAQALYEEELAGLGASLQPPFFLEAPIRLSDRFLQLSLEELSYKRTDTPDNVRFVGAVPAAPPSGTATRPAWWSDVTAAEKVVLVSQGTVANLDFGELIEPTLEALADLPVLVVAATGRTGTVRNVARNARIAEYIPFDDLLPHVDVLVSNGGFSSVQQALSHGVPLVLAGETEDKPEVAARTAATGAAVNLATGHPAAADIRKAVESVLATPGYRENAERLQADYAAHDAFASIADTVDELMAE